MIVLLVNFFLLLAGVEGEVPVYEDALKALDPKLPLPKSPSINHGRFKREAQSSGLDVQFCSSISYLIGVLDRMDMMDQGPILLHTMAKGEDNLLEINGTNKNIIPINSTIYRHFMVLSHLPVTAITILLPDLLENDFTLPNGVSKNSSERLQSFQESLEELSDAMQMWFDSNEQKEVGSSIVQRVSKFISDIMPVKPDRNATQFIKKFTRDLKDDLSRAAEFALKDYFAILDSMQWSADKVVIAAEGFAYPGSFLFQYYENKLKNDSRIAVVDPSSCNATTDFRTLQSTLSNSTFHHAINMLFSNSGVFPLHSILSEAAKKVLNQTKPTFKGFQTRVERLYVILIVALLSATIVLSVMICSVYCEDKLIKMENKPVEPKRLKPPKGPSLLTPFAEKEIASSYSAFHQLKKKHMRRKRDSDETELLSPNHEAGKYAQLPDDPLPSSSTVEGTRNSKIRQGDS